MPAAGRPRAVPSKRQSRLLRPVPLRRAGLWLAAAAVAALAPVNPAIVDRWYSQAAYPVIQSALTAVSSALPVALLDVWLVLAAVIAGRALWRIAHAARGTRSRTAIASVARGLVLASIVYLAFLVCWGLNYRRSPLTTRLEFDRARVTDEAVEKMALAAVSALNGLHARAHAELTALGHDPALRVALAPAFAAAQRAIGQPAFVRPVRAKPSMVTPYFRWASIDGMINPLGLDIIVNPGVLPVERPFVLAHEWGHLAGWARESEASYLAWLTCRAGGPAAQYSGWLSLYWYLRRDVPRDRLEAIDARLDAGPRRDLSAIAARLAEGQPAIQAASWHTYDQFLKANRVEAGVRSYGEVVTLVVGTGVDAAPPRLR